MTYCDLSRHDATHEETHSCGAGLKVSGMNLRVLHLIGNLSSQGQPNGTDKHRASGTSQAHYRLGLDEIQGGDCRADLGLMLANNDMYGRTRIHAGQP